MTLRTQTASPEWAICEGDALVQLQGLPNDSARCCVTSPPYYGLRDYGVEGQIGLEPSPAEYIAKLVAVFAEVRRVLRSDGTLWVNIGDSYNTRQRGTDKGWDKSRLTNPARVQKAQAAALRPRRSYIGSKPKDLLGIPWMLAFALRDDGWWLRAENIWAKTTAMPESVRDRTTRSHEQVFMLTKSARYFYDADAIAEDAVSVKGSGNGYRRPESLSRDCRGQPHPWTDVGGKRNKRSVWTVSQQPYAEAHFATFPPKLIEPCILAGSHVGDLVLDPFAGAGTTGLVALRHDRSFLGIELSPEYAELARRRICRDAPLLNSPAEVAAA